MSVDQLLLWQLKWYAAGEEIDVGIAALVVPGPGWGKAWELVSALVFASVLGLVLLTGLVSKLVPALHPGTRQGGGVSKEYGPARDSGDSC